MYSGCLRGDRPSASRNLSAPFCRVMGRGVPGRFPQRNLIKSNRNQIVFTIFRLIWNSKRTSELICNRTEIRLVLNHSDNSKYNPISVWFNKISQCFPWRRGTPAYRTAVDSPALYIYTYINILHCTLFIFFIFLGNNSRQGNGFPFLVRRDAFLTALTILLSYAHKEFFS